MDRPPVPSIWVFTLGTPSPGFRVLDDRQSILFPIMGGVCPVSPTPPPAPPPPPPGEPHLIGASAGLTASLWVSGALLRFRSGDGNEYGETGASQPASPGARARSIKISSPDAVDYVDDTGTVRRISQVDLGAKPTGAIQGSLRYNDAQTNARIRVEFVGATNFYRWHNGFGFAFAVLLLQGCLW